METSEDFDFLSEFKKKKENFKATMSILSSFLRDWCGLEYEFASKLILFTEKNSLLSKLEKVNHEPLLKCIDLIKSHITQSCNTHFQLSRSLETISTQEIPRFKWDFKETCKSLAEIGNIASQEYRNKLTQYAFLLVNSKEAPSEINNENLQHTKSLMQEANEKNIKTLKEIKENAKKKAMEIEEALRIKIGNVLNFTNEYENSEISIENEVKISKILENSENGVKIVEEWLTPRIKDIHQSLEKLLEEECWVTSTEKNIVEVTVSNLDGLIKELSLKCKNSIDYWEEFVSNFIHEVVVKIMQTSEITLPDLKKNELPNLQFLLSKNAEFCISEMEKFNKPMYHPNPNIIYSMCIRLESLVLLEKRLPELFFNLPSSKDTLNSIIKHLKSKKIDMIDLLAYRIVKIELSSTFASLYSPFNLSFYLPNIKDLFQKTSECLSDSIFSELLQKCFFYFIDSWKFSVIKAKTEGTINEKINELKEETKIISIFFEAKQSDGKIKGISRVNQREYLHNNFDCISLSINENKDLLQLFLNTENFSERNAIAWIIIARGTKEGIEVLIENKQKLLN